MTNQRAGLLANQKPGLTCPSFFSISAHLRCIQWTSSIIRFLVFWLLRTILNLFYCLRIQNNSAENWINTMIKFTLRGYFVIFNQVSQKKYSDYIRDIRQWCVTCKGSNISLLQKLFLSVNKTLFIFPQSSRFNNASV